VTGSELTAHVVGAYSTLAARWDTSGAAWNQPVATRLVALVGLAPGMRVLDVGCGAGAVSIPAARAVAPGGRVTGIDLAAPMLTRARQAALAEGLTNLVFLNVDASAPSFGPASFDAVLASFVVYLLADPGATVARWRNLLRPGGLLAFTWVIAEDSRLEPVYAAVDEFLPDGQEGWNAFRQRHRWRSVGHAEALLDDFRDVRTVVEPVTTRYESPKHWWESSCTQAPALAWRHIPVSRRDQARDVAFKALEGLRDGDGSIARVRTVCYTLGRQAPSGAGG
jgi:ubiquinone/menaquinone biosynthesis C-methylase UbiE